MATRKTIPITPAEQESICKNCRAVHCSRNDGLRCRFFPPKLVYDPVSGTSNSQWPEVNPDGWCLQFSPQLSS